MSDVLFLVLTAVFFAAAWAMVIGCERLIGADDQLVHASDVDADSESDSQDATDRESVGTR